MIGDVSVQFFGVLYVLYIYLIVRVADDSMRVLFCILSYFSGNDFNSSLCCIDLGSYCSM